MSKEKKKNWAQDGLEDWGRYMDAKKAKLEEQYQEAAKKDFQDATSLFTGIAIFVNGYTNPCADELKRLMMEHGGVYHHYKRTRITTHIIASNLPYSKIVAYRKSQNPLPICKPEWITDSINARKVLDWRPYMLHSNSTVTQPQLPFEGKKNDSVLSLATKKSEESECYSAILKDNALRVSSPRSSVKVDKNIRVSNHVKSKDSAAPCTGNSEFLSEFYNNSRLHHISTMGTMFKDYVNEMREKKGATFPGLDRLKVLGKSAAPFSSVASESDSEDDLVQCQRVDSDRIEKNRVIMHIDMDCFFVSVGLRNRPELKGLPVAVTHAKGNKKKHSGSSSNMKNDDSEVENYCSMSEIASCSYEARKVGLKNGMFLGQALKLCPNLKTIKYDFEGYKQVSYILYNTVASYTLDIEAVSCDEMYADITSLLEQSKLTALEFASVIREEIKQKTGCPVSTGFGCNKLQARLATRKAKPDGQFYLESTMVREHIGLMIVRDLPGVGSSTMQLLHRMNVRTCSDLQKVALGVLQREFGKKSGEMLYNMCRGIDDSKLNLEHVRKTVSAEVNYGIRFGSGSDAEEFLRKLSQEVSSRLRKANAKGKSVTLKLMIRARDAPKEAIKFMGHGICDNLTKSKNLITPIDDPAIIAKEVLSLWNQMQQLPEDVRGIGIQIARLELLKSRSGTTSMMNFINRGKQRDLEVTPRVSESFTIDKVIRSTTNSHQSKINNEKVVSKNSPTTEAKPRGLEAFLAPEEQRSSKPNPFVNPGNKGSVGAADTVGIDQSVLAQLPADIKMEIMKSRRDLRRVYDCTDLQPSTSTMKYFHRDEALAATPPCFNNEEKRFNSESLSVKAPSMKNIDESVLNELPEDIRNEILGSKYAEGIIKSREPQRPTNKSRQTQQEMFFKHKKSACGKNGNKASMPPIDQIDMTVLVELPEDIRNEIINEYKGKSINIVNDKRIVNRAILPIEQERDGRTKDKEHDAEEANVSFSQVDPEFLAALSEDMKIDVEMYCMAKKKEKLSKRNKFSGKNAAISNVLTKNRNLLRRNKKIVLSTKSKRTNSAKESSNEQGYFNTSPKIAKRVESVKLDESKKRTDYDDRTSERFLDCEFTVVDRAAKTSLEQRQEIILHHSSFTGNQATTDEHREMLTSLVNYLFTLPVQQVKIQIQTWISKSKDVNEIDLLSLATFLSMLPKKKRLEDLHILLKTMHRCITGTENCVWHMTYGRTVRHIQRYMQIEYNSNLMLPRIECDRRECEK